MLDVQALRLMADYNSWMNGKVYETAGKLSHDELVADRGAFFKSILGTLNHLMVGDLNWLHRFAAHPAGGALAPIKDFPIPRSLNEILCDTLPALAEWRVQLDRLLSNYVATLTETDLASPLIFKRMTGEEMRLVLGPVLLHVFNHQTHHRGQVTTLLTQAGQDVGPTDLLLLLPKAI
jgi:uncharacterized damage-inducible protein DinB